MHNGTLVQQGTHSDLLNEEDSMYATLWAQQAFGDVNWRDSRRRRGRRREEMKSGYGRVQLTSDGAFGVSTSIEGLRGLKGIDEAFDSGGRGFGGADDSGWLW